LPFGQGHFQSDATFGFTLRPCATSGSIGGMKNLSNSRRSSFGSVAIGAAAIGAVAIGAFAIGALAIGRLAIRRLAIQRAAFQALDIQDLTVRSLRATDLVVSGSFSLPPGGDRTR
jgi:hypothetical protein